MPQSHQQKKEQRPGYARYKNRKKSLRRLHQQGKITLQERERRQAEAYAEYQADPMALLPTRRPQAKKRQPKPKKKPKPVKREESAVLPEEPERQPEKPHPFVVGEAVSRRWRKPRLPGEARRQDIQP